ncbi:hypothetical protein [Tardiphaga sp.]|uniref:hypothetical protein n=1 Tax=Tardiphaga sp. TaxID=1926292 RepID=UPI002606E8A8|nr:hypothetical protein [Tardiphaga sp.]MDB5620039.1 hypothetical protein [Tardiphaga sp.]
MKKSDDVIAVFRAIPTLLERDAALLKRGRFVDVECLLGSTEQAFHVSIRNGHVADMAPAPILMRPWRFAYRATPAAWTAFWKPMPKAGWHDLLALTKRGEAVLEGDIQPFMTHLQYFKDLLALPRSAGGAS